MIIELPRHCPLASRATALISAAMKEIREFSCLLCFALVFAVGLSQVVRAAEKENAKEKLIEMFDDWGAQTFREGKKTGCSMWSQPIKDVGKYKKRGAIYAYITHRPWEKRVNEVSFAAGYRFKKDSTVRVRIGGEKFKLFTNGETAWGHTAKDDNALIAAMRRGNTMVVFGISRRGTQTTDTYSLKGFSKAYNAINKACRIKQKK
jgi:hypothetical protein